jgi:8-oxo-dGTP diphosphatase
MSYNYKYPKADNTVDAVVFSVDQDTESLKVLLIRRGREKEPFFDHWALPGGFIEMGETLRESLRRELIEETGLNLSYLEQLGTFGDPGRDPRGRVISTAFLSLVWMGEVQGGDDASDAQWVDVNNLPELAFDHAKIIGIGLRRLRSKVASTPIAACLLPLQFTLRELRRVCEIVLQTSQDKRNFRRKILATGILEEQEEFREGAHRPAKLYSFKEDVEVRGEFYSTREVHSLLR